MSKRSTVGITENRQEAEGVRTLRFRWGAECHPGQFIMVWIPGVDEVPMSLSHIRQPKGITVKEVGEATRALTAMQKGDRIGVRGPYGRGFISPEGQVLFVGGGVGTASILPAVESFTTDRSDMIIGALTREELLYVERARRIADELRVSTDDGSYGFKGTAVGLAQELMQEEEYSMVLGCGPEPMLASLLSLCEKEGLPCQLSLERFMKCGTGLCGSCAINGMRVCAEGPVFWGHELKDLEEFGEAKRDPSGQKTRL